MNPVDWLRMFKDKVIEEVNKLPNDADRVELKAKIMMIYQDQLERMITPPARRSDKRSS